MKTYFSMFGFVIVLGVVLGAFLWPYTINTWLEYFGKEASVIWWQGALLGLVPVVGQATIPVAVITWILMLFL